MRVRNRLSAVLLPLAVLASACNSGSGAEAGVLSEAPPEGQVVDLELDSRATRLLKAYPRALYRSGDGGQSWEAVPLPASVRNGLIADVATPVGAEDLIYIAGPDLGVLRSDDEGRTWTALGEGLPSRAVTAFARHADQPGTLYAFVEDEGTYRSENAGASWTRMDAGPGVPIRELFHSDMEGSMQTGWLFAATDEGVRRSMDCFCGWRPTGELPGGTVYDVAYDPRQPERVYAATASSLFLSEDGGESWTPASADGPAAIAVAADESGVLYAVTDEDAVLRSTDRGRSWERTGA